MFQRDFALSTHGSTRIQIEPATTPDALRRWRELGNRIVVGDPITDEQIAYSIHRNPAQVRLLARLGDEPVGIAMAITDRLKPRGALFATVHVNEAHRRLGVGTALFYALTDWSRVHDGSFAQVHIHDDELAALAFWTSHGFVDVERELVVQLDVEAAAPPDVDPPQLRDVEVTTLADRPDLFDAAWRVTMATWHDIPTHQPTEVVPYDEWRECIELMPGRTPATAFVALVDGQPVGFAQLELPPGSPGTAWNGLTCVLREHRGRGIARLLKLHQVAWAKKHGIRSIRTHNDEHNEPMRHVNSRLGYAPQRAMLMLRGDLPATASDLGWDARWQQAFRLHATADHIAARVVRVDRQACTALSLGGDELRLDDGGHALAVGDWTVVDPSQAMVTGVLERRGALQRQAAGQTVAQVVAANVDVTFVVCSLEVALNLRRIERFVALAWQSGVTPVVVLSKADLVGDELADLVASAEAVAPGVDVVAMSSLDADSGGVLARWLQPGLTVVLLGQSGVGKSTLVNLLIGRDTQAVDATRGDGKGRHTTTHRELVRLPGGALLIDTPGVRSVRLWDADDGIAMVFSDLDELASRCRFGNCAHETEPDCAVLAAIATGTISEDRLASWRKLGREQMRLARRQDARARVEHGRTIKPRSRDLRRNPKQRRA